jgi:excinuclease ABC subunit A
MEVIKSADYIIDLGPEGGEKGGEVIGAGAPEELILNPSSYTGQFLQKKLALREQTRGFQAKERIELGNEAH